MGSSLVEWCWLGVSRRGNGVRGLCIPSKLSHWFILQFFMQHNGCYSSPTSWLAGLRKITWRIYLIINYRLNLQCITSTSDFLKFLNATHNCVATSHICLFILLVKTSSLGWNTSCNAKYPKFHCKDSKLEFFKNIFLMKSPYNTICFTWYCKIRSKKKKKKKIQSCNAFQELMNCKLS